MFTLLEVAQLAKNIAILAAIPVEARPQYQVLAVKTLSDLKENTGLIGLTEYSGKVATLMGQDPSRVEPWVAFLAGGPGKPPPAVALLRPPGDAPGAWVPFWQAFKDWTGPGQMIKILTGEGLPINGLLEAMEAAVGKTVAMVEKPIANFLNTVVVVVAVVGGTAVLLGGMYLYSLRAAPPPLPARPGAIQRHERRT